MPKAPKRSPIWVYFNEFSRDVAKCSICDTAISTRGGSTSNLRRHLKYKHHKIIIERTKSNHPASKGVIKGEILGEQEEHVEEEVIVVQNYQGNSFHSEVLFHDYAAIEGEEVTLDQSCITDGPNSSVWEQQENMKKSNIKRQTTQFDLWKKLESLERGIEKVNNAVSEGSKATSNNVNSEKIETFTDIAINLGRIATAFERLADFICNDRNGKQSHCGNKTRPNENGLDPKVNDIILNVLGEEIVNTSDESLVIDEQASETVKTSSLLKTLNLLPKNETVSKIVNCDS